METATHCFSTKGESFTEMAHYKSVISVLWATTCPYPIDYSMLKWSSHILGKFPNYYFHIYFFHYIFTWLIFVKIRKWCVLEHKIHPRNYKNNCCNLSMFHWHEMAVFCILFEVSHCLSLTLYSVIWGKKHSRSLAMVVLNIVGGTVVQLVEQFSYHSWFNPDLRFCLGGVFRFTVWSCGFLPGIQFLPSSQRHGSWRFGWLL